MDAQQEQQHGSGFTRALALVQAGIYIVSGLWPLASMRTFEAVTGPKTDRWLVKTVGLLIAVIGAVLGVASVRRADAPETALLAAGSAASLAAIDVVYVAKGRISKVYLLDALLEGGLVAAWAVARELDRRKTEGQDEVVVKPLF